MSGHICIKCMLKYSNFYFRWGDVTLNIASDGARYLQLNERQAKTRIGENLSDVLEETPDSFQFRSAQYSPLVTATGFFRFSGSS